MDMLTEALERLFREKATPAVLRSIEVGKNDSSLWSDIVASGFLDILLAENQGGAGIALSDAFAGFLLAGKYALPLPFVQTAMVRGWLGEVGMEAPDGRISIAGPQTQSDEQGGFHAQSVAYAKFADWVLAEFENLWVLLPVAQAKVVGDLTRASLSADLFWPALPKEALLIAHEARTVCSPTQLGATALSPLLAGAACKVLDMSLEYVAERQQFGRPISQFQAVQGQVSVMAERVWVMRMAARIACHSQRATPVARLGAIGKIRCSEAAVTVADGAHALHGAIGITEEFDLQLYTRRLREWRHAGGSEAWWARHLGRELVQRDRDTVLDFILAST